MLCRLECIVILFVCLMFFNFKNCRAEADEAIAPSSTNVSEIAKSNVTPSHLYQKAWKLVKEVYYDQAFNGQDWDQWQDRYKGKLQTLQEARLAISTMLASLGDPYTRLVDPINFEREFAQGGKPNIASAGVQLGLAKNRKVYVVGTIQGSPACKANVVAGWELIKVDETSVKGLYLGEIIDRIRGPENTSVSLTFITSLKKEAKITLERKKYAFRNVGYSGVLSQNIGYVRLDSLLLSPCDDIRSALNKFTACDKLVLDLRNNYGGSTNTKATQKIAGMFLGPHIILANVRDLDGGQCPLYSEEDSLYKGKLVLLVNKGTAGLAEILAASLKEEGGATIIGVPTFGKGKIQAINKLEDGSGLNITVGHWMTPKGNDISNGLKPDILVPLNRANLDFGEGPWWRKESDWIAPSLAPTLRDLQLRKAVDYLEVEISKKEPQVR